MVKVLCVSDHIDPLVYSTQVKQRFHDIDLVISAGDLPMRYLGFIASSLNTPVVFVFGNHNNEEISVFRPPRHSPLEDINSAAHHTRNRYGSTCAEERVVRTNGLLIAGLGGSPRYNRGPHQFTEGQMRLRIAKLIPRLLWNKVRHGRYLDILVTHAAPRGLQDGSDKCHTGFTSFLWFMRTFRPRYLLHGHIHLYDRNAPRSTVYHDTTIINVYDHYVLELNKGS